MNTSISKKIAVYLTIGALFVLGLFLYSEYNFRKAQLVKSRYTTDLPVVTQEEGVATTSVMLYYYNQKKDTDSTGNVLCSEQGLQSVTRVVPTSQTPLKDTLDLLLKGQLTPLDKQNGISTELPLEGVFIQSIALGDDGVLLIDLRDPLRKTVGGSCRTGILARQITSTAKQFKAVKQVEFVSSEVFQP
jgi:spore germination protein GerM